MAESTHLERLTRGFYAAPSWQGTQSEIAFDVEAHTATILQPVLPEMMNACFRMHGMHYFRLMDESGFFAAQAEIEDFVLVTTSFNLYFTRPVSSGTVRAVGKLAYHNKQQYITESVLYDEQSREIGRGGGVFMKSKVSCDEAFSAVV